MIIKKLLIAFLAISLLVACNTGTNELPKTEETTAKTPAANDPGFDVAAMTAGIDAMRAAINKLNTDIKGFEASCFDGQYITGDISDSLVNP